MQRNVILVALGCILLPHHMMVAMKKAAPAPQYTQKQLDDELRKVNYDDFARAVRLVEAGGNPDYYRRGAFDYEHKPLSFLVADKGTCQQLEILLNKGVSLTQKNNNGLCLLHIAAMVGNGAMVDMLCARGLPVNEKSAVGSEAIHVAAEAGKSDIVKSLLAKKASIEATDTQGSGVLHYAARGGNESMIKELLALNASIDSIDREGAGVIHHAALNGHLHLVRPLLAAKAAIDATDYKGAGILHYAVRTTNVEGPAPLIRLLLAEKATINCIDFEGKTPLHEAVVLKKTVAGLTLVEDGADTTIRDKKGKIALQYALETNTIAKPAEGNERRSCV